MRKLLLPLIGLAMLLITSAGIQSKSRCEQCRHYLATSTPCYICDVDSASSRLILLLERMQREGQISKEAAQRIQAELVQIQRDSMDTHYDSYNGPTHIQTPSGFDLKYRESTRNYKELIKPAAVKPQLTLPPAPKLIFPPTPIKFPVSKQ